MNQQPFDVTTKFRGAFALLQGSDRTPFPWQQRLFGELAAGRIPSALDLPTGLGKTSVMAIWLIARALTDDDIRQKLPRRLIYVVDRRAVVDQATAEAVRFRKALDGGGDGATALKAALGLGKGSLPISTLRGLHADNRDWLADPTRPAIIVGTVDMIGSRLLFSGYGVSRRMRPFHAGLLGADALLVLDEAHLVPPFEALLRSIAHDRRSYGPRAMSDGEAVTIPPFRLLSLSATRRDDSGDGGAPRIAEPVGTTLFRLDEDDWRHPIVARRLGAAKALSIHDTFDGKASLVDELAERAWALGSCPARVLVYCDSRADAEATRKRIEKLAKSSGIETELLVGQRRVHERQRLSGWLDQHGFTGGGDDSAAPAVPTFLVATAAGEVGIDLDADHMVCDLVAWERMVQRLGRVNRRGGKSARIEVVALPTKSAAKAAEPWPDRLARQRAPLDLLPQLADGSRDASPGAITALRTVAAAADKLQAAQTRAPLRPALTRALVDAWSMTSLEQHTGRPEIQPWLRGWEDDDDKQCVIVWREHLPVRRSRTGIVAVETSEINAFFEAAPPQLSEMLEADVRPGVAEWLFKRIAAVRSTIDKQKTSGKAAALDETAPVLFVLDAKDELDDDGVWTLRNLARLDGRDKDRFVARLQGRTLVVSRHLGGLSDRGMLAADVDAPPATIDSDDKWQPRPFRVSEVYDGASGAQPGWKRAYRFASEIGADEEPKCWLIIDESRAEAEAEDARAVAIRAQTLSDHQQQVKAIAQAYADALRLPADYAAMLALAAALHDEGKDVWRWQRAFNAPPRGVAYAKSAGPVRLRLLDGYRHEFGSLIRIEQRDDVKQLPGGLRDLLLHIVAAHHGHARPLISTRNCEGVGADLDARALEAALRFERLQRRWGPWGLAWWEALLRAADQKASGENDEAGTVEQDRTAVARSA
ncbi:type I-G CRISPR-associated helicase/endonuclease Cas3g [Bradyrhizobium sp. USDA 4353]